jgi:hypothetical protein
VADRAQRLAATCWPYANDGPVRLAGVSRIGHRITLVLSPLTTLCLASFAPLTEPHRQHHHCHSRELCRYVAPLPPHHCCILLAIGSASLCATSSACWKHRLNLGSGSQRAHRHRGPHRSSSTWVLTMAPPLRHISPPCVLRTCSLVSCGAVALLTRARHGQRWLARHRAAPPPTMHTGDDALVRVVMGSATAVTSPPVASPSMSSGRSTTTPRFPLSIT